MPARPPTLKTFRTWAADHPRAALAGLNLAVAAAYWLMAELVLLAESGGQSVTPVWPSAGIALVALWFLGPRLLPGVVIGVLAVRWVRLPFILALASSAAPAIEALIAFRLLKAWKFDDRLERIRDPLILALGAAPLAALAGASVAVTSMFLAGGRPSNGFGFGWFIWWLQDWLGIVTVGALACAWLRSARGTWSRPRVVEAVGLLLLLITVAFLIATLWGLFDRDVPLAFVFFPLVSWAGLRFGPRGAATIVAVLTGSAILVADLGLGPFAALPVWAAQCVLFVFLMLASISGQVLAAVIAERDDAQHKQLQFEEQLRHSQKMEAIGRLAGGIAHDFNNLLTAIIGYTELVLASLDPKDERRADAEEIARAAMRAADLTKQMLAFSRRQVLQPKTVNLNTVIVKIEPMLRRLISEDIVLTVSPRATESLVSVDPGQMEQVVVNLVVNARDAMPHGGRLAVETANAVLDAAAATANPDARPGPFVVLSVADSGAGISAADRVRIFEPYFTTKDAGKGTGLGLSTVYGIVRQSDGHINVISEVGLGTTVRVLLPRAQAEAVVETDTTVQKLPSGTEHVLLVEDDPSVRRLAKDLLSRLGYSVTEAASGRAGLALGSDDTRRFDLALCDVILGDMSGPAVAEALQALRPSTRVLYMSGYPDDATVRAHVLDEGKPFLQKPFTPMQLARKIREVLEDEGEAGAA